MDYKEKLRLAKEALESGSYDKETIEYIFPELKESEGGEMVNFIANELACLRATDRKGSDRYNELTKAIAWLEKQSDKPQGKSALEAIKEEKVNNANKVEPKFKVGDTIIKKHNSDIRDFGSFTITAIIDNKYWYRDRIICDITEQDEWEIYETNRQNAWSEDDERLCSCLIKEQEKSLDNVKNDKYGHSEIISDLKEIYNERIDWLKSIKERIKGEQYEID